MCNVVESTQNLQSLFAATSSESLWGEENTQGRTSWVDKETATYSCMWDGCGTRRLHTKQALSHHISSHLHSQSDNSELSCPIRGCQFRAAEKWMVHGHVNMHLHHAQLQMEALKRMRASHEFSRIQTCGFKPILQVSFDGLDLNCEWEYCEAVLDNVADFFDHITYHVDTAEKDDNGLFSCSWRNCSKEFRSKGDLRKHINREVSLKKCACPFCGSWMSTWEKFGQHLRRKPTSTEFQCVECHKFFADSAMLALHVPTHISKECCSLCEVYFRSKYELDRHMQTKHCEPKVKTLQCDVSGCTEVFKHAAQLVHHRQKHDIPQFKCKHCEEKFVHRMDLTFHKSISHPSLTKSLDYECHICSRRVDSGAKLSYHLRKTHDYSLPAGFSRFTFKLFADKIFRISTLKLTREMLEE